MEYYMLLKRNHETNVLFNYISILKHWKEGNNPFIYWYGMKFYILGMKKDSVQ